MYKYMTTLKKLSADVLKPTFHNFVVIMLVLYLVSETTIPHELFEVINEPMIKGVLIATCIYIMFHRPVLGCLLSIAFYELLTRNNKKIIPSLQANGGHSSAITSPYSYVNYENTKTKKNRIMRNFEQNKQKKTFESSQVKKMKSYYRDKPVKANFNASSPKLSVGKTVEEQMVNGLKSNYNMKPINNNSIQPVLSKQSMGNSI